MRKLTPANVCSPRASWPRSLPGVASADSTSRRWACRFRSTYVNFPLGRCRGPISSAAASGTLEPMLAGAPAARAIPGSWSPATRSVGRSKAQIAGQLRAVGGPGGHGECPPDNFHRLAPFDLHDPKAGQVLAPLSAKTEIFPVRRPARQTAIAATQGPLATGRCRRRARPRASIDDDQLVGCPVRHPPAVCGNRRIRPGNTELIVQPGRLFYPGGSTASLDPACECRNTVFASADQLGKPPRASLRGAPPAASISQTSSLWPSPTT